MMKKKLLTCHLCLSILLPNLAFIAMTSCNKEAPLQVGYFITVGGKTPQDSFIPKDEKVYLITRIMNDSIRAVYPKPNQTGNDQAVLRICNNVYRYYRTEHPEYFAGGYTVARLYRGWMQDGVIKSCSMICMWSF